MTMKKIGEMEQLHNHTGPAVYGSGWPISNGKSFREALKDALTKGFPVWHSSHITSLERHDYDSVRFKATLKRTLPGGTTDPRPFNDTFKIEGIIQSYQIVVTSPDSGDPEFYSYIRVWWDKDES